LELAKRTETLLEMEVKGATPETDSARAIEDPSRAIVISEFVMVT
jgi:hypothetical protein